MLSPRSTVHVAAVILFSLVAHTQAAYLEFSNCLTSDQQAFNGLQFVPFLANASVDTSSPSHLLNITVFGNVTGQTTSAPLPPYNSPLWNDPNFTNGKITNTSTNAGGSLGESALQTTLQVLNYDPVSVPAVPFCDAVVGGTECPVGPAFNGSLSDPLTLRAFGFQVDLNSSYRFATIDTTFRINSAFTNANGAPNAIGCILVNVTPDLGPTIFGLLRYLPVAILALVAAATISAAILSPWGSSNAFKWTSNYGRDEDLLRLVTPGFGDCLQYIQFVFLMGSLNLNYPGFFRPVVSAVNWSALMFNESFVSHDSGVVNPRDGVYATYSDYYYGTQFNLGEMKPQHDYGMSRLRQLVGLAEDQDIWAGTVIWLLVIIAAVVLLCQLFFFLRWAVRAVAHEPEVDLRSKNWPFTAGMLVRLVCNFFLLPLTAFSFYQLVVAGSSQIVVVVFAVVLLVAIIAFGGWILKIISSAKPRSHLFDDLPTVLLYGPLYNTYSDDAAAFALIPALLTFVRGIAFGAVQPSGIAQIVILAICEVIFILTLQSFRPFRKQTSMNAYHTFFALVRLITVLMSIAFLPSLTVPSAASGWVAYVILLLHAIVLVFGFLLNAVQTLIEVLARFAGAGADETTGAATRGTFVKIFGKRQLTRRRRRPGFRSSLTSDAAMLTDDADAMENKSAAYGGRSRSLSASSAILLNQRTPERLSSHLDRTESASGGAVASAGGSAYTALQDPEAGPSNHRETLRAEPSNVPFYRAPRQRRPTGEMMTPGARNRGSWGDGGSPPATSPDVDKRESAGTIGKAIPMSPEARNAPSPAYMRRREGSDPMILNDPRRADIDYAVREVDFYYNVRGPRLNDQPTRQLKTGPADPVGPVSSATGWFKTMFGRKSKDHGKGFEVVRSARAPPQRLSGESPVDLEPYQDNPPAAEEAVVVLPGQRTRSNEGDREQALAGAEDAGPVSPLVDSSAEGGEHRDTLNTRLSGMSDEVPSLAPIDAGSSIHVPSRFNSTNTQAPSRYGSTAVRQTSRGIEEPSVVDASPPLLDPIDAGSSIHLPSRFNSRATTVQRQASTAEQYGQIGNSTRQNSQRSTAESSIPSIRPVTPPHRVPFATPLSPIADSSRNSIGAASALSVEGGSQEDDGRRASHSATHSLSVPMHEDRPSSTGFVQQYRIVDRITQGTPELELSEGREAEVVQDGGGKLSSRSSTHIDR